MSPLDVPVTLMVSVSFPHWICPQLKPQVRAQLIFHTLIHEVTDSSIRTQSIYNLLLPNTNHRIIAPV